MYKLLLLFVFLVAVLVYYKTYYEQFDSASNSRLNTISDSRLDTTISEIVPIEKVQSGTGKNFINDNLFNDVIYHENDVDIDIPGGKTGLEKCFESCNKTNGTCVEFGITGNAFCFPPYNAAPTILAKDPNSNRIPAELLART